MTEITNIARTWLGTKFHHQGRKKNVGVDCIGLIIGVANELGIDTQDSLNYPRQPVQNQLQKVLEKHLINSGLKEEVIALFKIDKEPQHVGIITKYDDGLGIIHAYAPARKVVEHRLDDLWKKRLIACYELPKK